MPEYKQTDISQRITKQEAIKMCFNARTYRDKTIIALMYMIPVRPEELSKLKRSDFKLERSTDTGNPLSIEFHIETKKLKKTRFYPKRYFEFNREDIPDIFFKAIWKYVSHLKDYDLLFPITKRRIRQIVDKLGMNTMGRHLCPYAFRHSTLTRYAEEGKGIEDLMYLKGAGDIKSISPYLHGKKQKIKIK